MAVGRAREDHLTYVPDNDPLVLKKLERWQRLEIRFHDPLGTV